MHCKEVNVSAVLHRPLLTLDLLTLDLQLCHDDSWLLLLAAAARTDAPPTSFSVQLI